MNTYDDEATRYDGENNNYSEPETGNFDNEQESCPAEEENAAGNPEPKKGKGKWVNIGIGAASGVLIGGVSTFLMGMSPNTADPAAEAVAEEHPAWSDGDIAVATTVNDDMSFGEAFAAARAEVGPGGAFEWHGNVYGTYTADEWNGMTTQERHDFGDHFNWNHLDSDGNSMAQHSDASQPHDDMASNSSTTASHTVSNGQAGSEGSDDIEVVSVDHTENIGTGQHLAQNPVDMPGEGAADGNPEIEVLGVVHDSEANANVAGLSIDGQDVIVIDVDNDMTFDVLATDINGNGMVDTDEVFDIQGQHITVADLGGFSDGMRSGDLYTGEESGLADTGVDYSDDGGYAG